MTAAPPAAAPRPVPTGWAPGSPVIGSGLASRSRSARSTRTSRSVAALSGPAVVLSRSVAMLVSPGALAGNGRHGMTREQTGCQAGLSRGRQVQDSFGLGLEKIHFEERI